MVYICIVILKCKNSFFKLRYFIELSYNGAAYHGWQRQPNAISVQEVVEQALCLMTREPIEIVGAGRTDAGVHAKQIFAHFNSNMSVDPLNLKRKLNSYLPKDIAIHQIFEVHQQAHARFDALSRSYEYHIHQEKDPFNHELSYYFKLPLDVALMNKACELLYNYENFKCFSRSKTDVKTYNCTITHAKWEQHETGLVFYISANRFLRNMVRAIVGTLLEVGLGKLSIADFEAVIKSENRSEAGASVPGHALYLTEVTYPKTIQN